VESTFDTMRGGRDTGSENNSPEGLAAPTRPRFTRNNAGVATVSGDTDLAEERLSTGTAYKPGPGTPAARPVDIPFDPFI
jgi:hypothetical protein